MPTDPLYDPKDRPRLRYVLAIGFLLAIVAVVAAILGYYSGLEATLK